ncbi:MAG: malonyl-CoA decarboxylase family protein, partial [Pseudomonadota bacterium]
IPQAICSPIGESRDLVDSGKFDTAVFYSISNCQRGLQGVSFGNFLIKQVVHDLKQDFPNLSTFVTLSPIPRFRSWFAKEFKDSDLTNIMEIQQAFENLQVDTAEEVLKDLEKQMKILLAKYFLVEKRSDGKPIDPVARFHLGNGASLLRFNWMADITENGLRQSAGMMVNYKYDLSTVETNHETYVGEGTVNTTREIRSLAKSDLK